MLQYSDGSIGLIRWLSQINQIAHRHRNIQFEALYQFFGMSRENLLHFCKIHNELEYTSFIANDTDSIDNQLQNKYIRALYVNRETAENEFGKFIEQQKYCVFQLIGDLGTGKTNLMIFLSQFYTASHPVLFYTGTLLSGSVFKRVLRDFNLYFSAEDNMNILLFSAAIHFFIKLKDQFPENFLSILGCPA